jgi:type IV pilus assembly protein PilC
MPQFSYIAIEGRTGREISGTIDGSSGERVTAVLKARGLAPVSIQPSKPASPGGTGEAMHRHKALAVGNARRTAGNQKRAPWLGPILGRSISAKALTLFTRQLATLTRAGMPLVRALGVLAQQERNRSFCEVVEDIAESIRAGGSLSDGLKRHPRTFDSLYRNMVRAGEAGGALEETLDRLARFMEKAERIKGKVTAALTYPAVVVVLALGIVAALMVFVVPKFEQIFAELLKGQPLPPLTRGVVAVSSFVQHHAMLSCALVIVVIAAFSMCHRTEAGRRVWDRLLIRLPVLGPLLLKTAVARITRTLGTLLASGVPILEALVIARETSGNACVADAVTAARDRVEAGESLARPLEDSGIFPGMVTSMVAVGEETGQLAEMLGRIADDHEEEVDNAVAGLTSLIEPLMIVFLAVVVGTLVLALFLPIVSIIQHLM